MKSKLVAAVFVTAFLAVQAMAQEGPQPGGPRGMMQRLNLTDDQQKQFDALASDFRKDMVDRRAEIAKARLDLADLLKADNPDRGKIAKQIEGVNELEGAAKVKALDHWFGVNKILTPEQQKMWKRGLARIADRGMAGRAMRGFRWEGEDGTRQSGRRQGPR